MRSEDMAAKDNAPRPLQPCARTAHLTRARAPDSIGAPQQAPFGIRHDDARLAEDQHRLAPALPDLRPAVLEEHELLIAADQRREPATLRDIEAGNAFPDSFVSTPSRVTRALSGSTMKSPNHLRKVSKLRPIQTS